jgi:hypothetical protein
MYIIDDLNLNLISWSKNSILAIGQHEVVYLWNATTEQGLVLTALEGSNYISSVSWCHAPGSTLDNVGG